MCWFAETIEPWLVLTYGKNKSSCNDTNYINDIFDVRLFEIDGTVTLYYKGLRIELGTNCLEVFNNLNTLEKLLKQ
jgi:hypothetical protein